MKITHFSRAGLWLGFGKADPMLPERYPAGFAINLHGITIWRDNACRTTCISFWPPAIYVFDIRQPVAGMVRKVA